MGSSEPEYPDCPVCSFCHYNGRMYLHGGLMTCPNCDHQTEVNTEIYYSSGIEGTEVIFRRSFICRKKESGI